MAGGCIHLEYEDTGSVLSKSEISVITNTNVKKGVNVNVKVEKADSNDLTKKSVTDDIVNEVENHAEDLYEIEESMWIAKKSEDNVHYALL